ncbi:hypothetical protein [Cytobacillus sp. BC1816]|uniref:hypothetical protein n=1 Tax=Cytobacillus sp. BC1816 TaxID=3440154 RepID=UPI003F50EF84
MLGIWETKVTPIYRSHCIFRFGRQAAGNYAFFNGKGIGVRESFGLSILGCQLLRYIFYEPDGHSLEYKAVLEDEARPYLNLMYLS